MPLICWENHSVQLINLLTTLYKNLEVIDCVLDTKGGLIQGHKTILAACSPYLKKMFMDHHEMKIFPFKEVNYNDMKLILDFLYYGSVDVPVTHVTSLMETAELLQIKPLLCASLNFAEKSHIKGTSQKSMDYSEGEFAENLVKKEEEDLSEKDKGCETYGIQLQSASNSKEMIDSMEPSEKVNKDQSEDLVPNSNVFEVDIMNKEEGFQEELTPITFVAVNPVSKKSEELNDNEKALCVGDPLLKNPLEECPNNSDMTKLMDIKEEGGFPSCLQIKREVREDLSCDDTTTCVYQEVCSSKKSEELDIKFESICDISEFNLKEERPLQRSLDLENGDVDEPLSFKERREILKCGTEESSLIGYQGDITHGKDVGIVNPGELKAATADVNLMNTRNKVVVAENINSDIIELYGSLRLRVIPSKNEEDSILQNKPISHIRTQSREKQFACNISEKSFYANPHLTVHMRSHTGEKPFSCSSCGKSFYVKSNLTRHLRSHTGQKPSSCSTCGKSFAYGTSLNVHMRTPTGLKPFSCGICKKSFSRKNVLDSHMRMHMGVKPFTCSVCDKSFADKQTFNHHWRIHTEEKPRTCKICGKSFTRKGMVGRHM